MDESVFPWLEAVTIADLVAGRQVSAREVTEAALHRLERVDGSLRAFRSVWPERARRVADAVDSTVASRGGLPLAGVPIGVKAWDGIDSLQARRLIAAGCVPIGETAVPTSATRWQTWGHTERGPTINPWRPDRVPGGSSAGSAAAVAAGLVPLATGTDGAGSIRIPAAWCGIVGIKPTSGSLPSVDAASLNVGGPLARSVTDCAAYLDAVLGTRLVSAVPWAGRRVLAVWTDSLGYVDVDAHVSAVARAAAEKLHTVGAVEWVDTTVCLADPEPAWHALRRPTDPATRSEAQALRVANNRRLATAFRHADLIMTPTTPGSPHEHSGPGNLMNVGLTWAFNLSGHPAMSVPAGSTSDLLPVGLQLIARHGSEALLVQVAAALERVAPWRFRDPAGRNRHGCRDG